MDVTVVLVTYNSAQYVRECVESVAAQEGVQTEIMIVDNLSQDNTVEVVRGLKSVTKLMANRENIGFGRGCNQGAAAGTGRYIYLLNPDAQLVQRDGFARLIRQMEAHPRWGMAGTLILSPDGHKESPPAAHYPDQLRIGADFSHLPGEIAWIMGASVFLRRDVYEAVGGFDPEFFLSSEETDLCLRVRKQGYEIGFVPEVEARHVGFGSEHDRDPFDVWFPRMNGLLLFWKKHYPPEGVKCLARRNLLRARYRVLVNGLLAGLQPARSKAWKKKRRYQGIAAAAEKFLASA